MRVGTRVDLIDMVFLSICFPFDLKPLSSTYNELPGRSASSAVRARGTMPTLAALEINHRLILSATLV